MARPTSLARAWIGTIVFLFVAPGIVAGLIPWLITGWQWHDWGGATWVVVPIAWIAISSGWPSSCTPSRCSPCTAERPLRWLRPRRSS